MLPFEFCIQGPPVSHQTKNKPRLRQWKQSVRQQATSEFPAGVAALPDDVKVEILYYYEGDTPDVDNIIKPIQDAMIGVVYVDDCQVAETSSRKRSLDGSYKIRGASGLVLSYFAQGQEFLHIRVSSYEEDDEL